MKLFIIIAGVFSMAVYGQSGGNCTPPPVGGSGPGTCFVAGTGFPCDEAFPCTKFNNPCIHAPARPGQPNTICS
ncbi:hypothetical protein ACSS6W_004233 [Trichoderma asperelloides]